MKKKGLLLLIVTLLSFSLTGCGKNEGAKIQGRYSNSGQPIGYYSNEGKNRGGNVIIENDNDGAIVEILDHTFGWEGQRKIDSRSRVLQEGKNGYAGNPSKPLAEYDKNFFEKDNRYSRADKNYHGHLNHNQNVGKSSYYHNYNGKLIEKVRNKAASVPNVKEVQAIIYKNKILVALQLKDDHLKSSTINQVKTKINPYLNGKSLYVVTDIGTYNRVRNLDHDIRSGGVPKDINMDMKDLFSKIEDNLK